jgi:pantoate--beta-alanine ligase
VLDTVAGFRSACDGVRRAGERLALVPTMGALHAGHLSLMQRARERADRVAVTIFVNPTQFGPSEDLARYPRDLEGDLDKCRSVGVDLVFAPTTAEMYPADERTRVRVEGLTRALCGRSRPAHFEGVATIVTKLFAAAGPCVAAFGRKDYQQLKVIERLTKDLMLPVTVVGYPTVREPDGLAMSSRNAYLTPEGRESALAIPRALSAACRTFASGERRAAAFRTLVRERLEQAGVRVDYVEVADSETFEPLEEPSTIAERALLAIAGFVGTTRLIDNVVLGEDEPPA